MGGMGGMPGMGGAPGAYENGHKQGIDVCNTRYERLDSNMILYVENRDGRHGWYERNYAALDERSRISSWHGTFTCKFDNRPFIRTACSFTPKPFTFLHDDNSKIPKSWLLSHLSSRNQVVLAVSCPILASCKSSWQIPKLVHFFKN